MVAYIAPQTFREWHPIGITKSINVNKPFVFNIGTLPMLLWFANNKNNPNAMINVCKFLGNNLKNSRVENNSLISPFYSQIYDESDNFGSIVKSNGLYWWSYKSYSKMPYINKIIKTNNQPYNYNIDINIDLITFILNFISFFDNNHNNYNSHFYHNKNKKLIVIINDNFKIFFKYPYSIIIKTRKFKGSYIISILPINFIKLRLFITSYNPYGSLLSMIYMNYIKYIFEHEITTNNIYIKNYFLFKKGINANNKYFELIYQMFKDYMFLTEVTVNQLMINKNFY